MTPTRIGEISAEANSDEHTGHLTPLVEECLAEIERLQADRDHWRAEYKTLELAGDELHKQRDQLQAEKDRLIAANYELQEQLKKVAKPLDG